MNAKTVIQLPEKMSNRLSEKRSSRK